MREAPFPHVLSGSVANCQRSNKKFRFGARMKTQGEIEAAVAQGIARFEQDYMGRGPKDIHAYLIGDLLIVRLKGVLTVAEQQLVASLLRPTGGRVLVARNDGWMWDCAC